MKRVLSIVISILILTVAFPMTVNADEGPKPSVVVDFKGLEGTTYYVTLLSKTGGSGPYYASDTSNQDEIDLIFEQYKDSDDFYFLHKYDDCSETHQFKWTYYPPDTFKVLLYFPDTDSFIVSDICERYAFDSYFTVDLTGLDISAEGQDTIIAEISYNYPVEIISFIIRVLLTIALEIGIALLFGFREKKQILFIIFVNIVTQIALNVVLSITMLNSVLELYYILLEIAVFATEAILYTVYFKKKSRKEIPIWKPAVYALTANLASFLSGIWLANYIPQIF